MSLLTPTQPQLPLAKISLDHPHLQKAINKTLEAIDSPDSRNNIIIIGPTGVGKTHLGNRLCVSLQQHFAAEMIADTQCMPAAYLTVSMNTDRGFSWTNFYDDFLRTLGTPFPRYRDVSEARLKIAEAIAARKVRVVFIDELQHILHFGTQASAVRQSEVMKSLAEKIGVKLVGIGTYDLTKLLRANGQLSRRTEVVHFNRYNHIPEDIASFTQTLALLDQQLAGRITFRLTDAIDYMHAGCVGLVGILRDWLVRAQVNAHREGESMISEAALAETELPVKDRIKILGEAQDGEMDLAATETDNELYQKMLGGDYVQKQAEPTNTTSVKRRRVGAPKARRGTLANV